MLHYQQLASSLLADDHFVKIMVPVKRKLIYTFAFLVTALLQIRSGLALDAVAFKGVF